MFLFHNFQNKSSDYSVETLLNTETNPSSQTGTLILDHFAKLCITYKGLLIAIPTWLRLEKHCGYGKDLDWQLKLD